jgi:hypothetical protein
MITIVMLSLVHLYSLFLALLTSSSSSLPHSYFLLPLSLFYFPQSFTLPPPFSPYFSCSPFLFLALSLPPPFSPSFPSSSSPSLFLLPSSSPSLCSTSQSCARDLQRRGDERHDPARLWGTVLGRNHWCAPPLSLTLSLSPPLALYLS